MKTLDFRDFYRFLVSLGLGLLLLTVALPTLLVRWNACLLVSEKTYKELHAPSRVVVDWGIYLVGQQLRWAVTYTWRLAALALVLIVVGSAWWVWAQVPLDRERRTKAVSSLRDLMKMMHPVAHVEDLGPEDGPPPPGGEEPLLPEEVAEIELERSQRRGSALAEELSERLSPVLASYAPFPGVNLDQVGPLDLLLYSTGPQATDFLVQVKYRSSPQFVSTNMVLDWMLTLLASLERYRAVTQRRSQAILLLVTGTPLAGDKEQRLRERLEARMPHHDARARLVIVQAEAIETDAPEALAAHLGLSV